MDCDGYCIYNKGVYCITPTENKCSKCGWNPDVYAERKRKADEEREKTRIKKEPVKSKTDSERMTQYSSD